jgi:hypothetical protein
MDRSVWRTDPTEPGVYIPAGDSVGVRLHGCGAKSTLQLTLFRFQNIFHM